MEYVVRFNGGKYTTRNLYYAKQEAMKHFVDVYYLEDDSTESLYWINPNEKAVKQ